MGKIKTLKKAIKRIPHKIKSTYFSVKNGIKNIPSRIKNTYEIAERHRWNVFGIGVAIFIGVVGVLQMDMMYWEEKLWQEAHDELWFPELGISKLHAWEMFCICIFLAILIMGVSCITWRSNYNEDR